MGNQQAIKREKIFLPHINGEPDYDFMEKYARNIMIQKLLSYINYILSYKNI